MWKVPRAWRLDRVTPTADEVRSTMPGDDLLQRPDAVMDRAFTVTARPDVVWPWLVQLGKARAGWYLPKPVERFIPRSRRASRQIDVRWQGMAPGDVIPDYGGRRATFRVHQMVQDSVLVFTSRRGRTNISWSIRLRQVETEATRVQLRLRLGPIRRKWLANTVGEFFDLLTIAGMAAGIQERIGSDENRVRRVRPRGR
jgi:hypothetical protein